MQRLSVQARLKRFLRARAWITAALALVVMAVPMLSSPVYAASTTIKSNPILNSGSGSSLTESPSWSNTTHVTSLTTATYTFSGASVTRVTIAGSKNTIASTCTVAANVAVLGATGSTLASGSANLPRNGTTYSLAVNLSVSVSYYTIATTTMSFSQTGTGC